MSSDASLAQLVEHALRKRMVMGLIPIGGFVLGELGASSCQACTAYPRLKIVTRAPCEIVGALCGEFAMELHGWISMCCACKWESMQ